MTKPKIPLDTSDLIVAQKINNVPLSPGQAVKAFNETNLIQNEMNKHGGANELIAPTFGSDVTANNNSALLNQLYANSKVNALYDGALLGGRRHKKSRRKYLRSRKPKKRTKHKGRNVNRIRRKSRRKSRRKLN